MVHNTHTSILLATDTRSDNARPIFKKGRKQNNRELIDVSQRGANLPDAKTQQNKPNKKIWTAVTQNKNNDYTKIEYEWRKINSMLKGDGYLLHECTSMRKQGTPRVTKEKNIGNNTVDAIWPKNAKKNEHQPNSGRIYSIGFRLCRVVASGTWPHDLPSTFCCHRQQCSVPVMLLLRLPLEKNKQNLN